MSDTNGQNPVEVKMPVNPDGTTNWQVVFDDPERGILTAVGATRSTSQLRAVMVSVAPLLFKRKRDSKTRAAFLARVDAIIDVECGGEFEVAQARLSDILRAEKKHRIEKADIYSKNKAAGQALERRRQSGSGFIAGLFDNPVRLAIGMVGALLLLTALGAVVVFLGSSPEPDATAENTEAPLAAKSAAKPAEKQAPAVAPSKAAPTPQQTPPMLMLALKPLPFRFGPANKQRIVTLVALIELPSEDEADQERLCAVAPLVQEAVTFAVRNALESGRDFSSGLADEVAATVRRDLLRRSNPPKLGAVQLRDVRSVPSGVLLAAYKGCEPVMVEQPDQS